MNAELKKLTQMCNQEIDKVKEKYKKLKLKVREKYKKNKKNKKQHIPKKLKNMVWDRYIGQSKGVGACYCCGEEIDSKNFEAGHIIPEAKSGPTNEENLRPICSCCNKSMGTQNMNEFKQKYMVSKNYNGFQQNLAYIDDRFLINQIMGQNNSSEVAYVSSPKSTQNYPYFKSSFGNSSYSPYSRFRKEY